MFLVGRNLGRCISPFFPRFCVEHFIATVVESASVEGTAPRFGLHFDGARAVATVLSPIGGGKDLEFGDGFRVWIDVESGVRTVIHVVAAVELPVVVLGAATVH